jgi:hypothetical protein
MYCRSSHALMEEEEDMVVNGGEERGEGKN